MKCNSSCFRPAPPARRLSIENQRFDKEDQPEPDSPIEKKQPEDETFDDDISKLSFKEKMTLFKKKNIIGTPTLAVAKPNRSRLTQVFSVEIIDNHFYVFVSF